MEAAGTIGRSVSVARPQSAPLRLHETATLSPIPEPHHAVTVEPEAEVKEDTPLRADTPESITVFRAKTPEPHSPVRISPSQGRGVTEAELPAPASPPRGLEVIRAIEDPRSPVKQREPTLVGETPQKISGMHLAGSRDETTVPMPRLPSPPTLTSAVGMLDSPQAQLGRRQPVPVRMKQQSSQIPTTASTQTITQADIGRVDPPGGQPIAVPVGTVPLPASAPPTQPEPQTLPEQKVSDPPLVPTRRQPVTPILDAKLINMLKRTEADVTPTIHPTVTPYQIRYRLRCRQCHSAQHQKHRPIQHHRHHGRWIQLEPARTVHSTFSPHLSISPRLSGPYIGGRRRTSPHHSTFLSGTSASPARHVYST